MKHYIITNRAILKNKNKEYVNPDGGEEATENLRFGTFDSDLYRKKQDPIASVNLFPDAPEVLKTGDLQAEQPSPYKKKDLKAGSDELFGSQRLFTEIYKDMSGPGGGDLLFFVHGFHNDFKGALQSICDLEDKYSQAKNPDSPIKHIIAFTWPSMDRLLRYRSDAKDAELSGYTLARCYLMLTDFFKAMFLANRRTAPANPCGHNIHLMAHSMGNRVIENMMIEIYRQKQTASALFKEVILAASDVDWQVFEDPRAFNSLIDICQRATVYFNTCDLALFISETTKNAFNRLGKYGFRDFHKVPSHVYSIDCSGVKDQKGLQNKAVDHWYYKESPTVVADITQVLRGKNAEDFVPEYRSDIPGNALQYRITK
jgi:esterase/lipase superfamily enzyme